MGQDYSANHCVARTRLRPFLHQRPYSLLYCDSQFTGRSMAEGFRAFYSTAVFISPFFIFFLLSFSLFCLICFPGDVEWGACLSSLLMVTATRSHCFWGGATIAPRSTVIEKYWEPVGWRRADKSPRHFSVTSCVWRFLFDDMVSGGTHRGRVLRKDATRLLYVWKAHVC